MDRNRQIIRASFVGIAANVLLASFKAVVGLAASSIAIVMDAVNNLSDVLSSVITIVGTKLSERPADKKHPFGHGRIEYFSAIVIAIIVLMAGATSLVESVKKVINPTEPEYTAVTLVVIVVAILVKIVLGRYVKKKGEELKSDALIASGTDALFDAIVTLATLVSAGIMLLWNVNLDGIFGTLISLVIIKAGLEIVASPVNELLGCRVSSAFVAQLKQEVMSFEGVYGVYDIIVNSYGPGKLIGSFHVNVPDTMSAREIHGLTRSISQRLYEKFGIVTTVGIYAVHMGDNMMSRLQSDVMNFASEHAAVTQVHAFYYYADRNLVTIDVVPDDTVKDDVAFQATMTADLHAAFPDYRFAVVVDHSYSE